MSIRQSVRRTGGGATALAAGLALAAVVVQPAAAQQPRVAMDGAWSAFVGCWAPIGPDGATADVKSPVCVTPATGASAVDVITIRDGKVASTTHLEASGASRAIGKEGCRGTESARWSTDHLRVYLNADITCDGVHRTTNGMMALSTHGEWLDVQGLIAGKNNVGVHVTRYRPLTDLTGVPAEVASAVPTNDLGASTARLAASGPIGPEDVLDASKALAAPIVEAWLLERGQGFKLNANELAALADAGVPGSTTDMMVALSYPKTFAVNATAREAELLPRKAGEQVVSGRTIPVTAYDYSPFGWGSYYDYLYGSRYGYRYGYSPYGYSPYGNGGGYYNQPIIIVRAPDQGSGQQPAYHPRVVNGQGWTQGATGGGSSTTTRSAGSGSSSSGASAGSSAGSASSGSSSGSSSSGGERTSHRVP